MVRLYFIVMLLVSPFAFAFGERFEIDVPDFIMESVPVDITIHATSKKQDTLQVVINGSKQLLYFEDNVATISYTPTEEETLTIGIEDSIWKIPVDPVPLWLSIIPPLVAIILALIFKEVMLALVGGVFSGAAIVFIYKTGSLFEGLFQGFFAVPGHYMKESIMDGGHVNIIIFTFLVGGIISLLTYNGGMRGVAYALLKWSESRKSLQFVTWLMGLIIFFDDYANALIVGGTMRPMYDEKKISRQKLAFIVDATAAPVSSLVLITTWIGVELSYIQAGISEIGIDENAYNIFLYSLTTRFYPIFMLLFILILIWTGRDFGPMLKAERQARKQLSPDENLTDDSTTENKGENDTEDDNRVSHWLNAVIPLFVWVGGTIVGIMLNGYSPDIWNSSDSFFTKVMNTVGQASGNQALVWSSFGTVALIIVMNLLQKRGTLGKNMDCLLSGFKMVLGAVIILVLAWSLTFVINELDTAYLVTNTLIEFDVSAKWLPGIVFILSALAAFATGSSWGTMAILYPLSLPASWAICQEAGLSYDVSLDIFCGVVSAILSGAVLGDHCSPISDTTMLSSLACSCNHIEHVRTQLPYAVLIGAISIFFGYFPSGLGMNSWLLFFVGTLLIYGIVRRFGKQV